MAKFGEGDPRWIVEVRPDGVNVNNWHWYDTHFLSCLISIFKQNILTQG